MYGYHWEKIDVGHYRDLKGLMIKVVRGKWGKLPVSPTLSPSIPTLPPVLCYCILFFGQNSAEVKNIAQC